MAGLLGSLHSAKSGMMASQISIQTTSHNITNINTPGYSRQRVEQSAGRPHSYPGYNSSMGAGQLGTGVQVNDITRVRNTFYDFQFRSESHNYGETSIKYEYYKNMESIFNEPSNTSISSSLNSFFDGWHELSKDPGNIGAKNVVVENAKYLANNINKVYEKLDSLQTTLNKQQDSMIKDVNDMLSKLEDLDKDIKLVEGSGKSPNDLLDERDRILDDLSFKININDPKVQEALKTKDANGQYLTVDEIKNIDNMSGEIAGTIKMNEELDKFKGQIKDLAKGIAEGVNEIYKDGDATKSDLFIVGENDGDAILKLDPDIEKDPSKLDMTADKALKMYNLRNEKITFGKAPNEQKLTINNFYNNIVQDLGHKSQAAIRDEKNQSKLLLSIDNSRLSVSGVAMDEEVINLIQFQHAYNASAKVVSTIDSLLDVVINGLVR